MSILITGGAGYIGSHVCIELLNEGFEIIIIDNFSNSKELVIKRIKGITGKSFKSYNIDLLDKYSLEEIFIENNIEAVIHLAGLKSVVESVEKPLLYYQTNIVSSIILAEMMEKYGVFKIVFSSSATVYGKPKRVPIYEEDILSSTNPYAHTKIIIEQIFKELYKSKENWSIAVLRYFNPLGAHHSGLIGEDPNGVPNNIMPYITQVAIGRQDELRIYGNDYPTFDGTGVRDYIHVVDLAKGHIKALQKIMSSTGIETYNLGTGTGYSVLQLVSTFEKVSGKFIPYRIVNRRKGDIAVCFANAKKAEEELGWKANKGLEEMCKDSWRWQLQNPNGYVEIKEYLRV